MCELIVLDRNACLPYLGYTYPYKLYVCDCYWVTIHVRMFKCNIHSSMSLCLSSSFIVYNLIIPSMSAVFSLLLLIVHLLYIFIVVICSMATVCSLLLVVVHLLYISIVNIYSMATVSTCKYCWQQVRRCDYEEHIGRSHPDFSV